MKFTPYQCTLIYDNPRPYLPATMFYHVKNGGKLYAIAQPGNGRILISTHPDPIGHICTYVDASAVVREIMPVNTDKSFIHIGATVYYVCPGCADVPVRSGEITDIYDDTIEIFDDIIGDVCVSKQDLFQSKTEAEAYYALNFDT